MKDSKDNKEKISSHGLGGLPGLAPNVEPVTPDNDGARVRISDYGFAERIRQLTLLPRVLDYGDAEDVVVVVALARHWIPYTLLWTRTSSVPSGGLTLIVGTQKWGFSCIVQRRPPADIFLNKSLPPKTPLRTPCSWPPWPWLSRENRWRFSKFRKEYETLTLTLIMCILQENGFKELTLVLFKSLF